ncbi:gene transfer agent family protein [Brucella pituitosa]|uniref:Gene transfer agent family protein n=2 Tax=Brucella pituitosa TaxID=571256 RepID=A0ABS3K0I5_9HYPH|nr:gene transfer agent family protein [Brucella pituitosa]
MMRDASIELTWADGDYTFRLGWGELEALQEACNAGPWVILERLISKQCNVGDISNVIRQGLIGGDMKPTDATKLVQRYVEKRPPAENLLYAIAILQAGIQGVPEEPVGEQGAASQTQSTASPMERSDLPLSTETVQF